MQKCHGVKVLKSYCVFSYHCGIILEINMKRYLKVILISSSANDIYQERPWTWPLKASLKLRDWKITEGDCREREEKKKKKKFKWEINIKHSLKTLYI